MADITIHIEILGVKSVPGRYSLNFGIGVCCVQDKQMKTDTLSKAVTQVTETNNGVKMSIY